MELDDYKLAVKQKGENVISLKAQPELAGYMRGQTRSFVNKIKMNLKFEIAFAALFLIFDCFMLFFFIDVFYLRLFTIFLLIFCCGFIYYVVKLLRYIHLQYVLDTSVKEQLTQYVHIISRFTRLYFHLTMVMIPLIFLTAFIAVYLDHAESGSFMMLFSSQTTWAYFSISVAWSIMMYFCTKWYLNKLYGNHLNKLKEQLRELQEVV